MGGFDRVENAIRVRDLIRRAASNEARVVSPKPLVGRMMSVDLPRLRGTVWFPGDDQPIQVNIFADAIPQEWQHKNPDSLGEASSTGGFGSQVVVESFDDQLYVTNVLTGGTAALDLRALGINVIQQVGAPTSAGGPSADAIVDIAGDPYETFINCRVTDASVLKNEAVEFGPFTTFTEGTPGAGFMEITVKNGYAMKSYRFVADPASEFDNDYYSGVNTIWFRLIAEQEITTAGWTGVGANYGDFDVDISFKKTAYGNDVFFQGYKEMWLRIVKKSDVEGDGIDAHVSIRATNIQKGRSLGGRELFMQEKVISPGFVWGILGFHGANHGFTRNENFALDVFNRVESGSWGDSNTQIDYVTNAGTSANYSVNGQQGVITISANAVRYHQRQNESRLNFDGQVSVLPGRVASGASIRMGFITNFDAGTSNAYFFGIEFLPSGNSRTIVEKRVGGVVSTTVGSVIMAYNANSRFAIRFQTINNGTAQTCRVKFWQFNFREPQEWTMTFTETATRPAGTWGLFAQADTGNTNTKNFDVLFENLMVNTSFPVPTLNGHATNWHTGPWRSGILRIANDLQKTWTHEGAFTLQDFSGINYIKWTGKIWLDGVGSHRNGMHNGRAYIEIPTEGGFFDARVFPVLSGNTGVVTVDPFFGFGMSPGQSLWCAVPPECGFDNLIYNMFYVDGQALQDYHLPEWAVLIAAMAPTGSVPSMRLGNGSEIDYWRAPTFGTGWSNYGSGYAQCGYRMDMSGVVRFKGLVKNTTLTATNSIFTLPVGFRPTDGDKMFTVQSSQSTSTGLSRLDISASTGAVTPGFHLTNGGAGFLSLEGITFNAT